MKNSLGSFKQLLSLWNINFKKIREDINIAGSPERTDFRIVVENDKNNLFIIENISEKNINLKKIIAKSLVYLRNNGLQIEHYLTSKNNNYIEFFDNSYWQIIPFTGGIKLDRYKYTFEHWRGESAAKFLINLKKSSKKIPYFKKEKPFSLINYINNLTGNIKKHNKEVYQKIQPIIIYLEKNFFSTYSDLPIAFCHGDYHSLNIIWGKEKIETAIDWEFLGYKIENYDIANMIGCIGIENPMALIDGFTKDFIKILKKNNFIADKSWKSLIDATIALRFAWLSEWLRKDDQKMIKLEIKYMKLLINSKSKLNKLWKI